MPVPSPSEEAGSRGGWYSYDWIERLPRIWPIDVVPIGDLIALARQRVTRGLTDEECRRYLHVDHCPHR